MLPRWQAFSDTAPRYVHIRSSMWIYAFCRNFVVTSAIRLSENYGGESKAVWTFPKIPPIWKHGVFLIHILNKGNYTPPGFLFDSDFWTLSSIQNTFFSQPIRCFAFNASANHRRYILYWEPVYIFCARFRNMYLLDSCPLDKSRWTIFPKGLFAALSRPLSLKTQIMITRVGELCVFRALATAHS